MSGRDVPNVRRTEAADEKHTALAQGDLLPWRNGGALRLRTEVPTGPESSGSPAPFFSPTRPISSGPHDQIY